MTKPLQLQSHQNDKGTIAKQWQNQHNDKKGKPQLTSSKMFSCVYWWVLQSNANREAAQSKKTNFYICLAKVHTWVIVSNNYTEMGKSTVQKLHKFIIEKNNSIQVEYKHNIFDSREQNAKCIRKITQSKNKINFPEPQWCYNHKANRTTKQV